MIIRTSTLQALAAALALTFTVAGQAQSADKQQSTREQVDDTKLTSRVKAALVKDTDLDAGAIHVETKDGIVQLSGFVPSEEMQTQALHTARAVEGVTEVRNDITVRDADRSAGPVVADSIIEARVKESLKDARLGDTGDVNVEVQDGVVQLSGFVANLEAKNRAADTASTVEGVRDVRNNIALGR